MGGGTKGQGMLTEGWDGKISCTGSLIRIRRIPNGDGVLEQGGASAGGGLGEWATLEEGLGWGQSLRGGGGDDGLKPRPFLCNHVFIDHMGAFEDVCGCRCKCVCGGGGGGWQGVFAGS